MNSSVSPPSQRRRVDLWLVAIVLLSAIAGAMILARARNWAVMTDELLYTSMARSIAETILPLAQIRGESAPVNLILFPTMIAPIVGTLAMPTAYSVIAAANGIVFATAAIPAYLLTHLVTANRSAARWVAACTVVTPWLALGSKALPDSLAYVAVLWAAYAMVRTVGARDKPLKGDLLTLLAIALAYLVRNQFLLLVAVWAAAVVLSRIGETLGAKGWRELARELIALLKERPVPLVNFVLVFVIVKLQPMWLLGIYNFTTTAAGGGAVPSGIVHAFLNHASVVALGIAGLPFILGLPWLVVALARFKDRIQNDAAVVITLLSCAVLYVAASFDVRFTEYDRVIERYVFYFAPLMLVAMAAFFSKPPKSLIAFAAPAIAGLLLLNVSQPVGSITKLAFQVNHAFSPVQIALVVYQEAANIIGTSIFGLMTIAMIVMAGGAWWLIQSGKGKVAQNVSFALVLVVLLTTTGYAVPRIINLQNQLIDNSYGKRTNDQKSWIDQTSGGEPVSLLFTPRLEVTDRSGAKVGERVGNWWDLVFWNKSIDSVYVPLAGNPQAYTPVPGPAYTMKPDWETGAIERASGDASRYLAMSSHNPNFAPQPFGAVAEVPGFVTYKTGSRATAAWATRGLTARGWVPPSGATLRVWAPRGAATSMTQTVDLYMASTRRVKMLPGFKVEGADSLRTRRVGRTKLYSWTIALSPGEHADFKLMRGSFNAHVDRIDVSARPG